MAAYNFPRLPKKEYTAGNIFGMSFCDRININVQVIHPPTQVLYDLRISCDTKVSIADLCTLLGKELEGRLKSGDWLLYYHGKRLDRTKTLASLGIVDDSVFTFEQALCLLDIIDFSK